MFKPTLPERIVHKIDVKTMGLLAPSKRKRVQNTDFTIISNNCWGGVCYEHYGIKKLSPTVGSFIMTDDYLDFIENLDYYLTKELNIIPLEQSKHYELWKDDPFMRKVPIGLLENIEIVFLHYKNPEVAMEKWNRRVHRINKDNMIFKFSYMNNCTDKDVERFVNMSLPGKRFCFVKDEATAQMDKCLVHYHGFENSKQIYNDTYYWDKYFDVTKFINTGGIEKK